MFATPVDETECPDCGGQLAHVGPKDEANGKKFYADCTECGREYGSVYVSYDSVSSEDDFYDRAEEHVRNVSE